MSKLNNSKILFFEFWNTGPHLETSFEIAKIHLGKGDSVKYFFLGHAAPFKYGLSYSKAEMFNARFLPERRLARLIKHPNFEFIYNINLGFQDPFNISGYKSLEEIKSFKYREAEVGLAAVSTIVSMRRSIFLDINSERETIALMLQSGALVYDFVVNKLSEEKPDLVYFFNGRFCNYRSVMNACDKVGVKYKIHERGSTNERYSVLNFMPHDFKEIRYEIDLAWKSPIHSNIDKKKVAQIFFEERRKGIIRNWIPFTGDQEPNSIPTLDPNKKILVFFTSSDDEYYAVGDIVKWDRWPDQFSALGSVLRFIELNNEFQLVIRLHPNLKDMSKVDQDFWLNLKIPDNVMMVSYDSAFDSYAILDAADIIITVGSTMGIESVYWGKPSICLGPSEYESLGAVYLPRNEEELNQLLLSDNLVADPEKTYPFGFYYSTFGIPYKYYKPFNLSQGTFLGTDVYAYSKFFSWLAYKRFIIKVIDKISQFFIPSNS